ncbi:MAG: cytochrome bc complex cytochrome b subunit [Nitriliruptoraceae bacterium]|nr:cytochrome bc complex cytochrome b subunit [Nitriliruptoraceae bacterium]
MTSPLAAIAERLDRRIGRRADPPSLWPTSFGALISHAAIAAFLLLTVTGIALALVYRPSVAPVIYEGSAPLFDGRELPGAFASIITISEDIPGGLLLRRVHVAASHLFMLATVLHLLRTLLLGAFRRPRMLTHATGVGLLLVALGFSYTGELLPYGLVTGSSMRIAESVLYALPLAGEQLADLAFDGGLPSQRLMTLAWAGHVFLLPLTLIGLLGAHLWLVHRRRPALEARPDVDVAITAVGRPLWPDAVLRFALLTAGLTGVVLLSAALVPWADLELEGPFLTAEATNSVHPPWPLFFLTGGLRVVPAVDLILGPVRITNVLIAGVVLPGILVGMLALYPWLERRVLDDRTEHHRLDHPLEVPFRTGSIAVMTSFALVLTFSAGIDVLAFWTGLPVERIADAFLILLVLVPAGCGWTAVRAARRFRAARLADPLPDDPVLPGPDTGATDA